VRVRGVVVCYDAGWHQLYIHDERETLYFNADDFASSPNKGDLVEITGKARGTNVLENPKLAILGQTALPAARPLELSDLGLDHGEWVEVRGRVLSAESSRGRLALLLHDKGQNCLVYLLGGPATNDFKQWLNCRVQVRGINASRMAGDRLESGLLFVPGPDEIKILEPAGASPRRFRWCPLAVCSTANWDRGPTNGCISTAWSSRIGPASPSRSKTPPASFARA
jgi:hypothetical protein